MHFNQLLYSLPPFLTAALLGGLAMVALIHARHAPTNGLLAALCLLGSLLYIDMLIAFNVDSARVALYSNRIGHLFHPFLVPLFIHFFHAYLGIKVRRWLIPTAYVYAGAIAACAPTDELIAAVQRHSYGYFGLGGPVFPLMAAGAVFATCYNLAILYRAIGREKRSIEKNKLKYVFIGFGILGVLSSLNTLPMFGWGLYPPGAFGFVPLTIFAAGVFRYDLLDMGLLIRKSLLYTLLTALLTALYALIIICAQLLFKEFRLTESILFPLTIFGLITFVFGPLKSRVQILIDHFFAKGRYEYRRTIKQVSQNIATVLDYTRITQLLQTTLIETMQIRNCALFVANPSRTRFISYASAAHASQDASDASWLAADAHLVQYLRQKTQPVVKARLMGVGRNRQIKGVLAEMDWLRGEVILPMRFKNRLNGFLVLGEKRSGELYAPEELDLLETLCHQSAVAIENAQAYQALHNLNKTLETKVEERTRDLRSALEEKERTQEQLIRSESLAALGQLVAGVAHELNNPLTSVTSLLQSTVEDLQAWDGTGAPGEDLIDDLQFADKELARAKSIVSSLLGLARQTQTYAEQVDLNTVVHDALRVLYNQYKHTQLDISEDLCPDLPSIGGNFANLGQVALNIIKNAIQAVNAPGGRIVLETRYDAQEGQVVFSCQDNGPGIEAAVRQDVFKPFFTTKPVGQGTGLGLYICHEIVRKHYGTISLEEAEPKGARVIVRLPIQASDSH